MQVQVLVGSAALKAGGSGGISEACHIALALAKSGCTDPAAAVLASQAVRSRAVSSALQPSDALQLAAFAVCRAPADQLPALLDSLQASDSCLVPQGK